MANKDNFIPCDHCNKSGNPGYTLNVNGEVVECSCLINYNKYQTLFLFLKGRGVPVKYIDYSIREYVGKKSNLDLIFSLDTKLPEIVTKGLQLFFYGKGNTQKTSVACYLLKISVSLGFSVYYITMSNLISELKLDDFNKEKENNPSKVSMVKSSDIIVVDDCFDSIMASKESSYHKCLLESFFRDRNDSGKSTIYLSKRDKDSIDYETFGEAFKSILVKECLDVEFKDEVGFDLLNKNILKVFKGIRG